MLNQIVDRVFNQLLLTKNVHKRFRGLEGHLLGLIA